MRPAEGWCSSRQQLMAVALVVHRLCAADVPLIGSTFLLSAEDGDAEGLVAGLVAAWRVVRRWPECGAGARPTVVRAISTQPGAKAKVGTAAIVFFWGV